MHVYLLCFMNDLIKPCSSQQRGLGNIRSELHRRAPMVSLCLIYIQQYTGPQPTPKHTYTNHSRHAKLNLSHGGSVHAWITSGHLQTNALVCKWPEGKGQGSQNMSSSFRRPEVRLGYHCCTLFTIHLHSPLLQTHRVTGVRKMQSCLQ